MLAVDIVFSARVFLESLIGFAEYPRPRVSEGVSVKLRVVNQGLDMNVVVIGPRPALDDMQRIAVGIAVLIRPYLGIFEPD
jgi:hypothetical protein